MPVSKSLYHNVFFFLCISVMWLYPVDTKAQSDSIVELGQIEVSAERINLSDIGKHSDRIDSQTISIRHQSNLASLLSMNTPLYVRTYGAGTLATLGIRGGSASHTQLLWNGIPLRNPMIGLQDIALIPSVFIDEATIHYGGHGAAFGSGAVGGLISIANSPIRSKDEFSMNLTAGSWGLREGDIQWQYGFGNLRFSSRLFTQHAENNYRYRLSKGTPERNQIHHELQNQGLLQEVNFSPNKQQEITCRIWIQNTDRQIPPTSTQNISQAAQQDKIVRASVQWNYSGARFHWELKSAWLDEINDYQDTLILLYTHNRFRTWFAEGVASFHVGHHLSLVGGLTTEVSKGQSANYKSNISRNQTSVFSSARIISKDWLFRLEAREELTSKEWSPVLLDLAAEWSGIKKITLKTSLSRNYRLPTLNDLSWRPGGNPDLVPEQGWTFETGIHFHQGNKEFNLYSSMTGYTRTIDQWIMWLPPVKDLREYWSPINIAKVLSSGLETRGTIGWSKGNWTFNFNTGIDFTWSVFKTPLKEFNIEAGDQLFYVPVENIMTGISIEFHQWSGYYNHHWFGTSNGINDKIEAADIGSAGISLKTGKGKFTQNIYLQVENAWNIPYRIIERRPMPGRSFIGGVKFSF